MQDLKLISKSQKSLEKWLLDDTNKLLVLESSLEKFNEFLSGQEDHLGVLSNYTDRYGKWIFSQGLLSYQKKSDGEKLLRTGFGAFYLTFLISCMAHDINPKKIKNASCSLHKTSLWMAIGLALGYTKEVDIMGRRVINGLPKRMFSGTRNTLSSFIPALWADYKGESLPNPVRGARQPEEYSEWNWASVYKELMLKWKTENPNDALPYLLAACDYHIKESKYSTDNHDYEFDVDCYQIYPQEILAVFRLRDLLGLKNPTIDHPIIANAFGAPMEAKSLELDEHISRLFQKIKNTHPHLEGPWEN